MKLRWRDEPLKRASWRPSDCPSLLRAKLRANCYCRIRRSGRLLATCATISTRYDIDSVSVSSRSATGFRRSSGQGPRASPSFFW